MKTEIFTDENGYKYTLIKSGTPIFERPHRGPAKAYRLACDTLMLDDHHDAEAYELSKICLPVIERYDMQAVGTMTEAEFTESETV